MQSRSLDEHFFSPCDDRGESLFEIGLDVAALQLIFIFAFHLTFGTALCFLSFSGWGRIPPGMSGWENCNDMAN